MTEDKPWKSGGLNLTVEIIHLGDSETFFSYLHVQGGSAKC